ncbi:MAG: MBOAT family protein [Lewinella sp.]
MLFSSLIFLTLALPLIWGGSLALPNRWQNAWLLLVSLIVYAWGGVSYTAVLLGSILMNYIVGLQLTGAHKRSWLMVGIIANLATLAVFKYTIFAVGEANDLLRMISIPAFELPKIALPLGISFYTFQAMSYLVDTYRGTTPPQRNIFRLGLYISFFPQLIAGPIVRYRDMDRQIANRQRSWEMTAEGLRRFLVGLAKKVLIANTLATVADEVFALDFGTMDAFTAWAGALLYAGQIYYDFSGYSDMAIGLGMLFGFRLPENFNYPYASKSIREFWRRWHITLGAWFRDYLYVPLGGSRDGAGRTMRNLLLVFLATGIWHGAAWAFVLWGLWHGLFIVMERQKWWPGGNVAYAFVVVVLGWVLFRTESAALAGEYYLAMFGLNGDTVGFDWGFYWNMELTVVGVVAVLGAWGEGVLAWIKHINILICKTVFKRINTDKSPRLSSSIFDLLHIAAVLTLFLLCLNALVNNALNPFIYFRF